MKIQAKIKYVYFKIFAISAQIVDKSKEILNEKSEINKRV